MTPFPRTLVCGCCTGGCMCAEHSPSRMAVECHDHAALLDPPRNRWGDGFTAGLAMGLLLWLAALIAWSVAT